MSVTAPVVEMKVDLDAAAPCEWYRRCPAEVEWAGRHLCCGKEFKLCGPHNEESKRIWVDLPRPIQCMHCGATPMPEPVRRPV
jgi:hypothetical protein